ARRYYETLRPPVAHLAALRFLRLAIPSLRPSFVPDGPGHGAADRPGVGKPVSPAGIAMETTGTPKFPGDPRDHSPCSPTPVGPGRLSGPRVSCLARPPRLTKTKAHHDEISGLNRTAFDLAVYASQWRLPATAQDSLPAAGPALPDGIGYPQGRDKRFHVGTILFFRASWRNVRSRLFGSTFAKRRRISRRTAA